MKRCFFCRERIGHEAADDHHVIPRRLFRDYPSEDPNDGNVARVHVTCHRKWNSRHDRIGLALEDYAAYMETLDWGYGIYAQSDAIAAD